MLDVRQFPGTSPVRNLMDGSHWPGVGCLYLTRLLLFPYPVMKRISVLTLDCLPTGRFMIVRDPPAGSDRLFVPCLYREQRGICDF